MSLMSLLNGQRRVSGSPRRPGSLRCPQRQLERLEPRQLLSTIFADDFNDNSIDPARWTPDGSTVAEADGILHLHDDSDPSGNIRSKPISISGSDRMEISRRVLLHYGNENATLNFFPAFYADGVEVRPRDGAPMFGLMYMNYSYLCPAHGFYLYSNGAYPPATSCDRDAARVQATDPVWDQWFDERLVYDPTTGHVDYFINDAKRVELDTQPLPDASSYHLELFFNAEGWYTGHEQHMDDLVVTEYEPCSTVRFIGLGECNERPIADDQGNLTDEDSSVEIVLLATDPEGAEVTYNVVEPPAHGTLSGFDPMTGQVTYLPERDWHGLDTFTFFTASDGVLDGEPATVYVRVDPVNDAPALSSSVEYPVQMDEDTPTVVDLTQWIADVETAPQEMMFIVTVAMHGQVRLLADGHSMLFTPDPNYNGPAQFTISVTDTGDPAGAGQCDVMTDPACELFSAPITVEPIAIEIDVRPVNDQPVSENGSVTVAEDGSITFQLRATDDDGDRLMYFVVAGPAHGCLELDQATGQAIYHPHEGYVGADSFQFQVDDGTGEQTSLSNVATVSITVTPLVAGFDLRGGVLTVIGTPGKDSIKLVTTGKGYKVQTNFGTFNVADRGSVTRVVVRARAGDDTVNVAPLLASQVVEVYGGAGNDQITGGAGHDILLGDAGNDTLTGGPGDDILIGGGGRDRLVGSAENDILIAGILNDPCRELNLREVLDQWRAAASAVAKRIAAQPLIDRVLDDLAADLLTGSAGVDLFVWSTLDRITDLKREDVSVKV